MTARRVERILIVEDNEPLRSAIARVAASRGMQVLEAATAVRAISLLRPPPDLILIDVFLPDGSAFSVLENAVDLWPVPVKVAISGRASPEQAFRLALLGVHAYLEKPISLEGLWRAIDAACAEVPSLEAVAARCVGQIPLREVQSEVRDLMMRQAISLVGGNRSGAARLLSVSRQAVQQMMRSPGRRPDAPDDAPPDPPAR